MTDFRALCAELVGAWGDVFGEDVVDRARAALAEPQPSDQDLDDLAEEHLCLDVGSRREYARTVLARWGGSQDAARYRWIKAAPGLRIERMPDRHFWISGETGEKYSVTHTLDAFNTGFSGLPGLDDLVDQAMEMYPIATDND
jgi:hypothetical protein